MVREAVYFLGMWFYLDVSALLAPAGFAPVRFDPIRPAGLAPVIFLEFRNYGVFT